MSEDPNILRLAEAYYKVARDMEAGIESMKSARALLLMRADQLSSTELCICGRPLNDGHNHPELAK